MANQKGYGATFIMGTTTLRREGYKGGGGTFEKRNTGFLGREFAIQTKPWDGEEWTAKKRTEPLKEAKKKVSKKGLRDAIRNTIVG